MDLECIVSEKIVNKNLFYANSQQESQEDLKEADILIATCMNYKQKIGYLNKVNF